jgi:hypothetical protein
MHNNLGILARRNIVGNVARVRIAEMPVYPRVDDSSVMASQQGMRELQFTAQRKLLDAFFADCDKRQVPFDQQYDLIKSRYPDLLPRPISGKATTSFIIYNASMATTAAPVKQPTGTAIRTMMQLLLATGYYGRVIEWGASFDGSAAATPGQVELIETGAVGATSLTTAYAAADIQPFGDPNATANTAGSSGVPFNLGTSASGFSTAAITEGSTVASRMGDIQMLPPTGPYVKQWPLGREFTFGYWGAAQHYLRVRNTFGTTVNATYYVVVEL